MAARPLLNAYVEAGARPLTLTGSAAEVPVLAAIARAAAAV